MKAPTENGNGNEDAKKSEKLENLHLGWKVFLCLYPYHVNDHEPSAMELLHGNEISSRVGQLNLWANWKIKRKTNGDGGGGDVCLYPYLYHVPSNRVPFQKSLSPS